MEQEETNTLNEIVTPAFGAELLSEVEPKSAKKKKTKKVAKPEPLLEGQVIGGKIRSTDDGRLLHTKEGNVAKFENKNDAIVASKRYGGRAKPSGNGFTVKA
jgi:hypothetical protein